MAPGNHAAVHEYVEQVVIGGPGDAGVRLPTTQLLVGAHRLGQHPAVDFREEPRFLLAGRRLLGGGSYHQVAGRGCRRPSGAGQTGRSVSWIWLAGLASN